MTQPADASQEGDHRFYSFKDEKFWSVTTILNVISKPALQQWAAKQAALYLMENFDLLTTIRQNKPEEVVRLVSTAHKRTMERSSWTGNEVHEYVQHLCEGRKILPDYRPPHVEHFNRWVASFQPEFLLSEATVYNRKHSYAGTLDMVIRCGDENILVDLKTGNNIYPEVALQLAAYSRGEFIGKDGQELELPKIDRAAVLHVRPNGYKYKNVTIDDKVFDSFLACRELFDWVHDISKGVIN